MSDDSEVPLFSSIRSGADLSPEEFEQFVVDQFSEVKPHVDDLHVTLHEVIGAPDGDYDFDATIRWRFAGFDYLTLVEAKRHSNPIKRDVVQVLYSKVQSVGAQKGIIIATAPFQRGAISFAKAHGVGLVKVVEGRSTIESRSHTARHPSVEEAREWGVPDYVGEFYSGTSPDSTTITLITGTGWTAASLLLDLSML